MYRLRLFLLLVVLFTLSCNLTVRDRQNTEADELATTVAQTLTAYPYPSNIPSSTQAPVQTATFALAQPSQTPSLTATNTITPTETSSDNPKQNLGAPNWQKSFDAGNEGFYDDDDEYTIISPQNGALVMTSTLKVVGWRGWSLYYHELQDFLLEETIHVKNCSGSDSYGMVFHAPDISSGYFYGVTCDGQYNLSALNGGNSRSIISFTTNSAINQGSNQTNRLAVKMVGNQISLYANDVLLQNITDNSFPNKGTFGIFIAAKETAGFTIELDDISYWIFN